MTCIFHANLSSIVWAQASTLDFVEKAHVSLLVERIFHKYFTIRMDLHENPQTNTVTATFELPGINKEDVNIGVRRGRLTVSAESRLSTQHQPPNGYVTRERRFGKMVRTLQLPQGAKVGILL
jgi:HSP20 family protein